MVRLVLIRHGQTEWNKSGRYQGQSDVKLSEEGLAQARCLAEHFPVAHLDAVYASDLSRAMMTAEIVAEKFNLEVRPEPAFRELSFGDWEGLTYEEIVAAWPDAMRNFLAHPDILEVPNGESFPAVQQRALERLGYDLGRWGVDGDFGPDTDAALRRFQRDHALTPDGAYGPLTRAAMVAALEALPGAGVVRFSGDCYIRSQPSTAGAILGVAKRDSELPYGGRTAENGWLALRYGSGPAWVSGKYGRLVN